MVAVLVQLPQGHDMRRILVDVLPLPAPAIPYNKYYACGDDAGRKQAAKATEKVKQAAVKAAGGEVAPVVYVQYQGEEEKVEDLVAAAKAAFAAEHSRTKVSDLKLYIKPEERAAYYVVNEKFAGRVDF